MKLYPHLSLFFLIWIIAIFVISYFGFLTLPHSGYFDKDYQKGFANWDGGHFLGIAQFGYSQNFQYAFFPLYPLMVRIVQEITHNYLIAAIFISLISAFLGIQILYKLLLHDFDKKLSEKIILGLLFFPTSFYFLTAYSESLFFLLVVCTFYFLKVKKIFWATVFASLASATRLAGLALVVALLIEVVTTQGISRKNWYIIFAPLGFLIYCLYLYFQAGDPFYFLVAELHWQRNITIPTVSFWQTLKSLSTPGFINNNFTAFLDLVFAIFGVGLTLRAFRFLPPSYSVFTLASVLIPLFTPTLASMPRFLLPIFPIFILIGFVKNKFLVFGYQLISIMLLAVFVVLFMNGFWVS